MAKKTPLRKCIGCGEMIPKKQLLRIVKNKDGEIKIDMTGKENGRGAYLHLSEECFEKAVKSKGLERSFKMSIEADVYDQLKKELMDIEAE
ncbi:MAG: YlxR family protein [Lachnospiraceae bacterium]|nr:YlxR family protein [Lachnospiraceae bacterium]